QMRLVSPTSSHRQTLSSPRCAAFALRRRSNRHMDVKELKDTIEKLNREFGEFNGVLEGRAAEEQRKFGETLGETKAKLDAINTRIDQLDVKLQRHQVTAPNRADESEKDREY